MAFIGNTPAESYVVTVKDSFNGTGSQTDFTLSQPSTTNDVRVVVENVVQEPTTAYTVSGTTLTFTAAPASGTGNIYVIHLGPAVATAVPPETFGVGSIYGASDPDTAITFEGLGVTTFDQNGTEAARFDASGNLLVGTTETDISDAGSGAGVVLRDGGGIMATRSGDGPLRVNRLTSDGPLVNLYKDGSTVGLIGTVSDNSVYLASGSHSLRIQDNGSIKPADGSGGTSDNTIDLGNVNNRFRDFYLSGAVYFGTDSSANALDDYEEGTWTATSRFGTVTGNDPKNSYIKVGQKVTVWGQVSNFSDTSTNDGVQIGGLPFTVNGTFNSFVAGSCLVSGSSGDDPQACYIQSDSRFAFYQGGTGANILKHNEISGGGINIWFIVTYYTSA